MNSELITAAALILMQARRRRCRAILLALEDIVREADECEVVEALSRDLPSNLFQDVKTSQALAQ
jgi:hypothetical protein